MASALWADWSHTANSAETRGGDWEFSFSIADIVSGIFVGLVPGAEAPLYPDQAWFGIRLEKQTATVRASVVVRNPATGANAVVSAVTSAATQFNIAHFRGEVYLTAGASTGTLFASDGSTGIAGDTLLAKYASGYSGTTRLVAGFLLPDDSITSYAWEGLTAGSTDVYRVNVDASNGTVTITLPDDPSAGDTVTITATGGAVTVDGGAETIDGSATDYAIPDGDTVQFEYDGTTWISTDVSDNPVTGGFEVDTDTALGGLESTGQVNIAFSPLLLEATGVDGFGATGALASGVLEFPALQVFASEADVSPESLTGGVFYLQLTAFGTLFDHTGSADLTLGPLQLLASDGDYSSAFLTMPPFVVTASGGATAPEATPYFEVVVPNSFSGSELGAGLYDVVEQGIASSGTQVTYVQYLTEAANALEEVQTYYNPQVNLVELAAASATVALAYRVDLTEAAEATAQLDSVYVLTLIEQALAVSGVETRYQAVVELIEQAVAQDAARHAAVGEITESATVAETIELARTLVAELTEAAVVVDELETHLTLMVTLTESAMATDDIELSARYMAELLETATASVSLKLADEQFTGWVMNTEGDRAVYQYENFKFNSFAQIDGVYYGASETGLYSLEGETDAGDPISARIKSLMVDFGTSRLKRVRSAYLGYTSDGRLMLKVRAAKSGELVEHWFEAKQLTANTPREQRVTLAMGLKSRYWQFELENVDGSDFEIDEFEMHPLMLQRRV